MKLSDIILTATEHDTASPDAEQILTIAKAETTKRYRTPLRTAAILAAVLCVLTATLYAAGVLSGFARGFSVPMESGDVRVLAYESDNAAAEWSITEVWYDSYNLHIGGTVKTADILDPAQTYKASASFRSAGDDETYYLDGTLYPNGTDTVPFVMSAPTVTDGTGGKFRPGWTKETAEIDLTIDLIHLQPENMIGQWDTRDYAVYTGTWSCTLAFTKQEHSDTVTVTGSFSGTTEEAVTAEQVKLSPFTLKSTAAACCATTTPATASG